MLKNKREIKGRRTLLSNFINKNGKNKTNLRKFDY